MSSESTSFIFRVLDETVICRSVRSSSTGSPKRNRVPGIPHIAMGRNIRRVWPQQVLFRTTVDAAHADIFQLCSCRGYVHRFSNGMAFLC
jgi:hypothetical protein